MLRIQSLQISSFFATLPSRSPSLISISKASATRLRSPMAYHATSSGATGKLLFRQLFEKESSTYTYLLADVSRPEKPALLIDPVDKTLDRDLLLIQELGLKLIYAMNTHVHADHVTGTGLIKGKVPGVKSIISRASNAKADLVVEPGDKIYFGDLFLEVSRPPSRYGFAHFDCQDTLDTTVLLSYTGLYSRVLAVSYARQTSCSKENHTQDIISCPLGILLIQCKGTYTIKLHNDGSIERILGSLTWSLYVFYCAISRVPLVEFFSSKASLKLEGFSNAD